MIAEEKFSHNGQPKISVSNANVVLLIIQLMKQTAPIFKSYILSDFYSKGKLNEDEYTQIYVEQAQILIRQSDLPFNVSREYRDIYNLGRGYSDFYFYPNEQDISTASLFSVESKRLPSPERAREKEYVIGTNNNGGIERYKTEKHGKGLNECGLLGFIEKEDSNYWETTINSWIKNLAKTDTNWNDDEILSKSESNPDYCHLKSIAHRKKSDIRLVHLWVTLY